MRKLETRQMSVSIIFPFLSPLLSRLHHLLYIHSSHSSTCLCLFCDLARWQRRDDKEGNLNEKTFCHSASSVHTIVREIKVITVKLGATILFKVATNKHLWRGEAGANFQRFLSSNGIWFICSKRENISPLHWIKCTARHIIVVTRTHFQIPLNHKIFHYCQALSQWPGTAVHWINPAEAQSGASRLCYWGGWWEPTETRVINPCCWRVCRERGPGPRRWWDGGRVRVGAGARASRHTRTTAWIYHPSQGPDPWPPPSDVILGSSSRYREEEKSLRKIYFDDTAPCREKDAVRVNFLQSGGTWMIVLAVINIKGFLLS